jgi:hypothetical protein
MCSADAKKTVERIGAPRFLGSAVFHPDNLADEATGNSSADKRNY